MWQLVYNFYLFVSSAAVFVLLARSARTGIVPADFFRLHDCSGLLLLHIELMLFFLIENSVPFRQLIEPVGFGIDHVLVETFLIEAEVHFSVLIHRLNRVALCKRIIDTVKESDHDIECDTEFVCQFLHCALDNSIRLCEQKGIKLVLIKAPSLYPAWYDQWDKQVVDYAAKYGLEYINFYTLADETGIDYNTDTYDAGLHLNLSGAEKLSAWFGKYLKEKCGVEDRRSDAALAAEWAQREEFYEFMKEAQYKQLREEGAVTRYK